MNRIDRKQAEFLICHHGTMRPTLGMEMDDASHERTDRQEQHLFADQVFAAADLPLPRVPAQLQYNTAESGPGSSRQWSLHRPVHRRRRSATRR